MADDWDVSDEEMDKWLEEFEALDREAADFLLDALPEIGADVDPGPELQDATDALRAGVVDQRWPFDYFVHALGQIAGADADWLDALTVTISPFDDPQTDPDAQSALMALEHADWLGMVIGLVRRGVGAAFVPEQVQADIVALVGIEGEIEDPDGHLAVLTTAVLTLTPLWQALRVLDEDERLTTLGRWGLPRALHLAWATPHLDPHRGGALDFDPIDTETERAALDLLARLQPTTFEALRKELAKDRMIVDEERLRRSLIAHEEVFEFADESIGHLPTLTDGLVLTHVLTAKEIELGALDAGADLDAWAGVVDEEQPLAGGGVLRVGYAIQGHPLPGDAGAALFGPDGWLDGFAEGEVIALRRDGEAFVVEKAEFPEDDDSYSDEVLAMVRAARAAAEFDADYGDPSIPGASGAEIVFRTRLAEPTAFTRPLPPISGLLEAVGLEVVHGYVGLPGTPWFGEPEWFDDRQREVWRDWSRALEAIRRTGSAPGDDALTALAAGLHEADLVSFAALDIKYVDAVDELARAMETAVSGSAAGVPLYLLARVAEAEGEGSAWLDLLERAVAADATLTEALGDLADLRGVAGDAREAKRLYALAGVDGLADDVSVLRPFLDPPAGPGRNKPCPCGSGKKYKVCHGRTERHPLGDRAAWLWRKIAMFAQRPTNREELLIWGGLLAGRDADDHAAGAKAKSDPTTLDFAVYDGDLLRDFLSVLGALLPADERELAGAWLASERRLMEVLSTSANGIVVQDLLLGDSLEVRDRTLPSSIEAKDLLYGRPLDDGTGILRFRNDPLTIPRLLRSPLLDMLRRGADAEEIAALLAPPGRPQVRTTDGQEFLMCTARYAPGDLEALWAELSDSLEAAPDGSLMRLGADNTVLGRVERQEGKLVLTANAIERLRTLQSLVTDADPEAKLVDESTVPLEAMDMDGTPELPDASGLSAPDLSEADLADIRRQFEDRWLADTIPALGGVTPREAAASTEGRKDLAALLDDFEWENRRHPSPFAMDVDRLRKELGLT